MPEKFSCPHHTLVLSLFESASSVAATRARRYLFDPIFVHGFIGPELDDDFLLTQPPYQRLGERKIRCVFG